MGYEIAAEMTNRADINEPEEDYRNDIPDGFRLANIVGGGGVHIEREVDTGERWEEFAIFTHPNASYDWAEEFSKALTEDSMRVIYDWTRGEWLVEVRVEDE